MCFVYISYPAVGPKELSLGLVKKDQLAFKEVPSSGES